MAALPPPDRSQRSRPPSSRLLRRSVAGPALVALLALSAGCTGQGQNTESTRDDPEARLEPLVRTPSPLSTDVPATDPPLVVELPGASGGPPGTANPTVPDASPGADQDGGDGDQGSGN